MSISLYAYSSNLMSVHSWHGICPLCCQHCYFSRHPSHYLLVVTLHTYLLCLIPSLLLILVVWNTINFWCRIGIFWAWSVLLFVYSWIAPPVQTHKNSIAEKTERATTIPRPPLESSWWGESKSALTIFVKLIFDLFFWNNFLNIVQRKSKQSDSPCRILVCQDIRSFWGACPAIEF